MFIYIVRHAWAGHYGDPEWADDSQRPLTSDGKQRFVRVAEKLVAADCRPAIIATSPLVRCRQTAEILALHIPGHTQIVELDALAPSSDLPKLLQWTRQQDGRDVAWVGHMPDVGLLTAALIGAGGAAIRFAKAGAAAIRFDERIEPGRGELYWLATAKLLDC